MHEHLQHATRSFSSSSVDGNRLVRTAARTAEDEPRAVVWVYDYNNNTTRRMKATEVLKFDHQNNLTQVPIPLKPGRVPIGAEDDVCRETGSVVARVHISMGLRLQRWLGLQKRLYIIDAISPAALGS
ncbi:hypothetical protein AAFC00_006035 [Neodothiora populina]|uniref:Amine oxidase n=1 Tax=Neodothiora populina TaxID=2781224 RepID=A0ABR3P701_9PEZI